MLALDYISSAGLEWCMDLRVCGWLWAAWALYWAIEARRASRPKWRQPRAQRLAHHGALVAGFLLIFAVRPMSGPPRLGVPWLWPAATAAGLVFAVWARRTIGRHWSGEVTLKEGHELISTGPYALVRHPIYTGFLFAVYASAAAAGDLRAAVGALVLTVTIGWKMTVEESALAREFGPVYERYRGKTRLIIPFVL